MMQRIAHPWVMLLLVASLAACRGGGAQPETAASAQAALRFVMITHLQASDPNGSIVKNGMDAAARAMGVRAEYQAPESFDMVTMSQLIDAALASNPDGLVVTLPDANALGPAIRAARDAGIPVVSMNSGSDVAETLGVLTHVGQTEYEAGLAGGRGLVASGVRQALCVNMEVGNVALDQRCQGMADAMQAAGASARTLAVELADPTETQQRIQAALRADPTVDGLLTLGPTSALPALAALRAEGKVGRVHLATFDLSPEILDAIEAGEMLFAIDQQMYLQGYLPIVFLTLYKRNMNTIVNPVIQTGPAIVTAAHVAKLKVLARQGTR